MKTRSLLFATVAWLQLVVSLLLATAIVWGYMAFRASAGQFLAALAASVGAVSTVVVRTAETVEARQAMLDETQKTLVVSRKLINELKGMVENQAKLGPQYAAGMNATASFLGKVAGPLQAIGEKMMDISIPSIQLVGMKPVVTMTKSYQEQGRQLKESATEVKAASESLAGLSNAIGQDGQKVSSALIVTIDQALKLVGETEKTLARLHTQDLPLAIADLRATSRNLQSISIQVGEVGQAGVAMLVVGLLLASWCIVHSLGAVMLARSKFLAPGINQAAVIDA